MTQTLQAQIQIPDDLVIITKVEYMDLKKAADEQPVWWTFNDLSKHTQRSRPWLMNNIINNSYFRRKISPFTIFPSGDSGHYRFQASRMKEFLETHFEEIKERVETK